MPSLEERLERDPPTLSEVLSTAAKAAYVIDGTLPNLIEDGEAREFTREQVETARGVYEVRGAREHNHDPQSFTKSLEGHPEFQTVLTWAEQARHHSLVNPLMHGAHRNIAYLFTSTHKDQ